MQKPRSRDRGFLYLHALRLRKATSRLRRFVGTMFVLNAFALVTR